MINEIVKFTESVPARLMNSNLEPKPGLHILFRIPSEEREQKLVPADEQEIEYYGGKSLSPFLDECAVRVNYAWCINTNKCFDLPYKGIHTCSPYCVAFKRESLRGGGKHKRDKIKLEERFSNYFDNALALVEESKRERLKLFANFFKDTQAFYAYLENLSQLEEVKEKDYIIFYLDEPVEAYREANEQYLKDKLFNTDQYNVETEDGQLLGTSDFFNGFNSKKPYLQHQSATFKITGRISAKEARKLYEFKDFMQRKIFPNPLPIFVNQAEANALQQKYNRLIQLDIDQKTRMSHKKVMKAFLEEEKEGLGNFYLLYYSRGEIKDFDFVPKFEYELKEEENSWRVHDLFRIQYAPQISNVFELQEQILPVIFDNSLVVRRKDKPSQIRYFDDIDAQYCKSSAIFLLIMRFRKAFYDFIYKSRRQAVNTSIFQEIMRKGILENIRLDTINDGRNKEEYAIKQKLNIWISFYAHFEENYQKSKDMVNHIEYLRSFMEELAEGKRDISTDEEGAFAAGQVIAYLFSKISSDKQPHSQLEPFLRRKSNERFKEGLVKLFDRYKHVNHTKRFSRTFSQLLACEWDQPIADYLPILLSGYFSENELKKAQNPEGKTE